MSSPDPTLLDIFAAEQAEHISRMRSLLEALDPSLADSSVLEELLRRAHTLKGASRAAGFDPTETLMHSLEGSFAAMRSGERPFRAEWRPVFLRSLEAAEDILAAVLTQQTVPDITGLLREIEQSLSGGPATADPVATPKTLQPELPTENGSTLAPSAELVRVSAVDLDQWMNVSSELVAATEASDVDLEEGSRRVEDALRQWWRLRQDAAPALRSLQRDPEFLPVVECIQGAERQINLLLAAIRFDAVNRQRREWDLRRLAELLDQSALRVRMVTAETMFGAFGPMVRNLAREHSKEIEFRAEGLELPVDRLVLQLLKDPVMHLLRNALSHGIESTEERTAAGKPPAGTIRLLLSSRGDRLHITVEDDGRGLDRRALAGEAARQGLRDALSDQGLEELIFRPGFSTSTLTTLSGRGMGLSVVHHEVARLHGEVRVESMPGRGTSITLLVPLSISTQNVLLVTAAGQTFGILSSFVERLCRVRRAEIETHDGKPAVVIDSIPVTLARLTSLLDLPTSAEDSQTIQAVVVVSGGRRAAIAVDSLIEARDAVIKPLGLGAADCGVGAGAIPMADGGVAVILNVTDLFSRLHDSGPSRIASFTVPERAERVHKILVVDDSMTTRSLEKSLLEAHGFDVNVAVDGIEALEKLRAQPIDLVITDLMMPRMDGFQLLEQIRLDKALARTPVIVVSSMESREDQERGLALGADAYIVKRKFDQRQLLETVRQIL